MIDSPRVAGDQAGRLGTETGFGSRAHPRAPRAVVLRILHVHAGNVYGGTERVLETLAIERRLCPRMNPSFALCFEGRLSETLRRTDATVTLIGPVRLRRFDQVWSARRRLAGLLRTSRYDAVVTHSAWTHALFAPVARSHRVRLVAWIHDVLSGANLLERLAGRWPPDQLVCNSLFTQRAAKTVYGDTPTVIIHGPVSVDAQPEAERPNLPKHRNSDLVVAHVGRLDPLKGHHLLIEALSRCSVDTWTCWFIGGVQTPAEHRYLADLRRQVIARGLESRVFFLGSRTDVAAVLREADIYCQPNTAGEAFGLSLVEAMNAGLPVVTTRAGAATEIVNEDCGILVAAPDATAFGDALESLLKSRPSRLQLGQNGPRRARALCEPGACLDRLATTVEEMVEHQRK